MLLVRRLSKTNSRFYRIRHVLLMLWQIVCGEITVIEVHNFQLPQMGMLEKCMREHPEKFNGKFEYSLVEERPFLKVITSTTVKVEQTNLF